MKRTPIPAPFSVTISISPSPREFVDQLTSEERVAIDLILERGDEHLDSDPHFDKLVPDKERRGYLITLARQLRALGVTLHDRETLGAR